MRATANEVQAIRVLLVEDEFLISEWVAETLVVEQGFAVHAVTNAADALVYLGAMPVDVLFTDVNLPGGLDGIYARAPRPRIAA